MLTYQNIISGGVNALVFISAQDEVSVFVFPCVTTPLIVFLLVLLLWIQTGIGVLLDFGA